MPNQYTKDNRPAFVIIGPSIALIPLTKGQYALIDSWRISEFDDQTFYAQWNQGCNCFYAVRNTYIGKTQTKEYLHRRIMNAPKGMTVDHKNLNNGLDCREANLRLATYSQQMANTRINSLNTSGYKGVYWHKPKQKWRVVVRFHGKRFYLGYFDDIEEANKVRISRIIQLFGDFARID